jgi:Flp pilus assembly protein TadG
MIMFTLSLPVLLGLIGIAVDGTILYVVEAKISAAVDGAALGAGRLLGTNANTTEIAGEFLKANFCGYECNTGSSGGPTGVWGSYNLTPTITFTNNLGTYTITINATVQVPLLFLRTVPKLVQQTTATVGANATATRRAVRTIMVLDRSGSMNNGTAFTWMQSGAESFAANFLPGTDEVGLIMLEGSANVGYPTTYPLVYPVKGNVNGGPDTNFNTSSDPPTGPLTTALQTMAAGGGTGTGEALALAYVELQQAHTRDLATNGVDNMLNSILLFTDGVPDSIAVSPNATQVWNVATNSWLTGITTHFASGSGCTYKSTSNLADTMMGTIIAFGSGPPWNTPYGLFLLGGYYNSSSNTTLSDWEASPSNGQVGSGDQVQSNPTAALAGCNSLGKNGGSSASNYTLSDLSQIPDYTIYGVSTGGTNYQYSTLNLSNGTSTSPYSAGSYSSTTIYCTSNGSVCGTNVAIAAWNAVDNIGTTIRSQTAMNQITIYSIGYSGDGGVDAGLLNRLANTPQAQPSGSVSGQAVGQYIQVDSADGLASAFQLIASYILHLSH